MNFEESDRILLENFRKRIGSSKVLVRRVEKFRKKSSPELEPGVLDTDSPFLD